MLAHLRVRNLGVLDDAAIAPHPGFTVITGETGAGKTMLLDALRLLVGEKGKPSAVGPFGEEAVSEGLFEDGESEVGVTRILPREGKSRAYLDGKLVSATALGDRVGGFVEIVGQHDQQLLRRGASILRLLDGTLDGEGERARAEYQEAWARYRNALDDQRRLGGDRMGLERELDLVRHQADEIATAGLEPGDDKRMESMVARLRNAEMMAEHLSGAVGDLEAIVEASGEVVSRLRRLAALDPGMEGEVEAAEAISSLSGDLLHSVRGLGEEAIEDPSVLEDLEGRLTLLGDLKRKYGRTLEEVLAFGMEAQSRAADLEGLIERAAGIDDLVRGLEQELAGLGAALSEGRRRAAATVETEAGEHLSALGLPEALVTFAISATEPGPSGADRVDLLFASDRRLQPGAVQEVASGGELSRLILALRLATRSVESDTLVFDEVDAGVGGATALALGRKLADLAGGCQVLCVTHLPQVAAHADAHYVIERSGGKAGVRRVEGEQRLTELSRMLAGLPESERGREAAAELLEGARP